jgi:hypothetical protein
VAVNRAFVLVSPILRVIAVISKIDRATEYTNAHNFQYYQLNDYFHTVTVRRMVVKVKQGGTKRLHAFLVIAPCLKSIFLLKREAVPLFKHLL